MTSLDFIRAEADNTDRILLYKEGLFWKAYERSAYILCQQVSAFKPTKKSLKSLGGGQIVSVGFPWKCDGKYIGALERVQETDERLTLAASSAIDPADFENWKAGLPLHSPAARAVDVQAARTGPELPLAAACAPQSATRMPGGAFHTGVWEETSDDKLPLSAGRTADFTLSTACAVAERVRQFNLAESTPMECMLFISELKKTLRTTP